MSKNVELKAKTREEKKKKVKAVRLVGAVPAVVYGRKYKSLPITVDVKEFKKKVMDSEAGRNLIFSLKVDNKETVPVITHALQYDALTGRILHIDFKHVSMDEKLKAKVPVEFIGGVPLGVKDEGGVLIHGLREIEIRCLPSDIPDKFEVDVSGLGINHSVHISDLKISDKVEILSPLSEMIASVTPPTKEEEVVAVPTPEGALAEGEAAAGETGAVAAAGAKTPAAGEAGAVAAAGAKAPADKAKGKEEAKPAEKAKPKKE